MSLDFSNCAHRGACRTFQAHPQFIEGRTNESSEGVEQVPRRAAVGDERARRMAAPANASPADVPVGVSTSNTSTPTVNTPAFRTSEGWNGERVPAVRNAAISTNLEAGTGSRRRVDEAAIGTSSAASICTKSRLKTKRSSLHRKMSRFDGPVLAAGSTGIAGAAWTGATRRISARYRRRSQKSA